MLIILGIIIAFLSFGTCMGFVILLGNYVLDKVYGTKYGFALWIGLCLGLIIPLAFGGLVFSIFIGIIIGNIGG